jgi:pyruvate/2-oxoglutarate dehydrogenase complex dihydrolipoamide dehydrogenase (E3) component
VERFCGLGAEVRFGAPKFQDDHVVAVDDSRLSAKVWIVATGSSPALPPVEGLADVPYWTNETVFSQRTLPNRLLVLGGGAVGLEMAQAFQRLGSRVTVVEFLDQILGPEDGDVAEIVRGRLEAEGMEILTGTKATRAASNGSAIRLTVAPAAGEAAARDLEADALLVATGRKPNVDDLGLDAAGVEFTPRGIPTDARVRTNRKHIFAAGDVNGQFPFTHVAGYEGSIALTNAVLHLPRKADYTKVPWCTYTDPEVASVGLNEKRAQQEGVEYRLLEENFADNDRALAEAEPLGKIKLLLDPKGKILGCQIVGAHAGELIHEWITALNGGVKLSTMAGEIHVYPTLSEISKRAAGEYYSDKLFSERTKSVLRFLFHLKGRACKAPESAGET